MILLWFTCFISDVILPSTNGEWGLEESSIKVSFYLLASLDHVYMTQRKKKLNTFITCSYYLLKSYIKFNYLSYTNHQVERVFFYSHTQTFLFICQLECVNVWLLYDPKPKKKYETNIYFTFFAYKLSMLFHFKAFFNFHLFFAIIHVSL